MEISSELRNFLIENKIYSFDKLFTLSMSYLIQLKGYSNEIGQEIINLAEFKNNKKDYRTDTDSNFNLKYVKIGPYDNQNKYSINIKKQDAPSHIQISNRLDHIISVNNFVNNLLEFFQKDDFSLLKIKNFGRKCLTEVKSIRKVLSLDSTPNYISYQISENTFKIPDDLKELSFDKLFLFSNQYKELSQNIITKVKRITHYFKDIDGKTSYELLSLKGIGEKTISSLIQILSHIHLNTFTELYLKVMANTKITNGRYPISGSYILLSFLQRNNIKSINDISHLDNTNLSNIDNSDRVALLELRTIHYNSNNNTVESLINTYKGTDLNLPYDIDNFINSNLIKNQWKEFILFRYDIDGTKISMEEIAQLKGITRERVRQILQNIFDIFKLCYITDHDFYLNIFLDIILSEMRPLVFSDIFHDNKYKLSYSPYFYIAFLSDLFEFVPFENYLMTENRKIFDIVSSIIKQKAEYPYTSTLEDVLHNMETNNKLLYLHAIFSSNSVYLEKKNNKVFLSKKYYSVDELLKSFLNDIDKPSTVNEFAKFLLENKFCHSQLLLDDLYKKEYTHLIGKINSIDTFVRIGKYTWGLEKHIAYPKHQWEKITNQVKFELKTLGHQADAGYLFKKIIPKYPKLRSKYELVEIIRNDKTITDFGFLNFYFSDSNQKERITVEQIIEKIFIENWVPKHYDEIVTLIQSKRTYRKEGITVLHKQSDFLKLYRPGYYGLRYKDFENLNYLRHHIPFIEKFITYRQKDTTFIDEIIEDMNIDYGRDEFIDLLKRSKSIVVLENFDKEFILCKNWGIVRIFITLLANLKRSMFFEELKIIAVSGTIYNFDDQKVRYKFDHDIRVRKNNDNSYQYNEVIAYKEKFITLLDEIEEYLLTKPQVISIEELFNILNAFSESEIPETSCDLLTLLSSDNRFSLLKGNMISLI